MAEPKYKTLQELVGTGQALTIDTASSYVYAYDGEYIFGMNLETLLEQALELLGIEVEMP